MIESIRRFNRYYARVLGVFNNKYLEVDYTPAQGRIIGEIGRNPGITAKEIADFLSLDKSYLSREIRKLSGNGLIRRERSDSDGREMPMFLTDAGMKLHAELDVRANRRIEKQIQALTDAERSELVQAMEKIRRILPLENPDGIQN